MAQGQQDAAVCPPAAPTVLTILLPALRHSCQLIMLLAQLPQLLPLFLQLVFQLQHSHLQHKAHTAVVTSCLSSMTTVNQSQAQVS